jgi:three-Cys-motif partner protein
MFLDPFGSQVKFSTIESIAKTEAIDLWYLFPAFLSVFRQISADGRMTKEQRESIERILGTVNWRETWIKTEVQKNLFGHQTVNSKQVEIDDITRFMISRMKTVFDGRVLDNWLPLGKDGAHWYSLLFAWANPGEKAKLAAKFANYVMTRS